VTQVGFFDRFKRPPPALGDNSTIRWMARTRFIAHACETFGDPSDEFSVKVDAPDLADLLILEFPPSDKRQRWTYLTAGLSLTANRRDGCPCELVYYWPTKNPKVAETLFHLCEAIAGAPATERFEAGHVINFGEEPEADISFELKVPDELPELLDFPNRGKRPEDERYLLALSQAAAADPLRLLEVSVKPS
jgi:hypothetical protein